MKANRLLSVGVAATFATTSLGIGGALAQPSSETHQTAYDTGHMENHHDGQEIFRGVFFGQGTYGEELAASGFFGDPAVAISAIKTNQDAEHLQEADKIMAELREADPQFFGTFEAKMTSGDPYQVQEAVHEGLSALAPTVSNTSELARNPEADPMCGITVLVGAFAVIAVTAFAAGNVVLFINAAAGGNVGVAVNWVKTRSKLGTEATDLDGERLLATLTATTAA